MLSLSLAHSLCDSLYHKPRCKDWSPWNPFWKWHSPNDQGLPGHISIQSGIINRDSVSGWKKNNWREKEKKIQTTNMISSLMNIHATTLRFTLFFRVSVYWFMYSVITSEMRLYDGNWWQPVVIFRWLMMRASLRGNRSKQLIYTARHNSHSSVSRSNSGKR